MKIEAEEIMSLKGDHKLINTEPFSRVRQTELDSLLMRFTNYVKFSNKTLVARMHTRVIFQCFCTMHMLT